MDLFRWEGLRSVGARLLVLPLQGWERRHRFVVEVLAGAVVAVVAFSAVAERAGLLVAVEHGAWVIPWLVLALAPVSPKLQTAAASIGLLTASASLVYDTGGSIATTASLVVALGVLWAYQSWIPFLLAPLFVVVSHVLIEGLGLDPGYARWEATVAELTIVGAAGLARLVNEVSQRDVDRLRHQNELLLGSAGEGIYGVDVDGITTFVNPAAARMLGWARAELVGQPHHTLIHHSRPDGSPYPLEECPVHRAVLDGAVQRVAGEVFWRRDGSSFPVELIATPLVEDDDIVGAVVTFMDLTERQQAQAYRGEVTRLTEAQAVQSETVHQLYEAVRPPVPEVPSAELGVHYLPADPSAPTGGDLYDWQVLPDGDVHLAVVDVVGKGVAATKDALAVSHALRLLVLDGCPLEQLVARADGLVTAQSPELVATVLVARYSPGDGTVRLAGAGHPPALLLAADGTSRYVPAPGTAIGWPGASSDEVAELKLHRSEVLLLYTDGLVESGKDILVGFDALQRAAAQTVSYPAPALARALVDRALAGGSRRDDTLALVLRRREPLPSGDRRPLGPFSHRFTASPAAIPVARHLLGDWLGHQPVDPEVVGDLLLVAAELCTNAVAAASDRPQAVALRAWIEGDAVVVEVEDDGPGLSLPDLVPGDVPAHDVERGRGLYIVRALGDEVSTRAEDGRAVVRVVKRSVAAAT